MWDSHAISTYLIGKYAKDDSLYPKDLYQRARIDQRLHCDTAIFFARVRDCNGVIFRDGYEVPEELIKALYDAYDLLETFLQNDLYLVGNNLTVADLSVIASVSTYEYHAPLDAAKYPKIAGWIERLSKLPYYDEVNGKILVQFREFMDNRRATNKAKALSKL